MKKVLSVLATFALLMSTMVFTMVSTAEENVDFLFTVKDNQVTLESYIGTETDVVIPEKIENQTVTTLAATLLEETELSIDSVTVPKTVTTIEEGALDYADLVFCDADSAAETYAQEYLTYYCVDNILYDTVDDVTTPYPVSVAVSKEPTQTTYQDGSNFYDLDGLELTFTFADGETDTWIYEVDEFGMANYQEYPLEIEGDLKQGVFDIAYFNRKTALEIEVVPNPVQSIQVARFPGKADYQGWELVLTEKDGSTKTISGKDGTVSGYVDTAEMSFATVLFQDADYGPVVCQVVWAKQMGATMSGINYMNSVTMLAVPDYDVDGKDGVTAVDALLTLQASTQKITLSEEQAQIADADGDGEISAEDALTVLQTATGKLREMINLSPEEIENGDWWEDDTDEPVDDPTDDPVAGPGEDPVI